MDAAASSTMERNASQDRQDTGWGRNRCLTVSASWWAGSRAGASDLSTPLSDQMVAHLDEAVSLTADQKAKIKDIYVKAREEIQAAAPEERREKMMEVMKSTREQVRAVLTPEQQTKFDAMRPPRGEHKKKAE